LESVAAKAAQSGFIITQEKDLVYLLVEIRKLMDREKYTDEVIRSFSDWVVHIELTRRLPMHFNFWSLQRQLRTLLEHFKLPTELTDEDERWTRFMFLYASIVGDCPITFKASKMKLKYVLGVVRRDVDVR